MVSMAGSPQRGSMRQIAQSDEWAVGICWMSSALIAIEARQPRPPRWQGTAGANRRPYSKYPATAVRWQVWRCGGGVEGKARQVKSSQVKSTRVFIHRGQHLWRVASRWNPSVISAHSLPPLLAAGAHSIGFRMVVCCLCIDLT